MKQFKKNPLRDVILIIVVAALSIFIFKKCFNDERIAADLPTYQQVKEVEQMESKTGAKYAEKQYAPARNLEASGIPKAVYDSVLNALGIEKNKVTALTLLTGKMQDSIKLARIERDAANNKVWRWEKVYKSGSRSVATMSEKDSVLHQENDLKVAAVDREEGRGKNKRYYVDFYPLDSLYKFNGAYVFRKEQKEIKDVFNLNFNAGFQKGFILPKYDALNAELELLFFPDGKISVGAGAGAYYFFQGQNFYPYWVVKTKYNVLNLRSR